MCISIKTAYHLHNINLGQENLSAFERAQASCEKEKEALPGFEWAREPPNGFSPRSARRRRRDTEGERYALAEEQ